MSKLKVTMIALAASALVPAALAQATILGPSAQACASGSGPAMLVRVVGLKDRSGTVRVRTFTGSPANYFDKTKALQRIELPTPTSGAVDICMKVPSTGVYAVDVRHDTNGNGKSDRSDGAGASGNPHVSLFDVIFKRRPDPKQVAVNVGRGVTAVPIVVNYVQGGSLKPIARDGQ
jgi:uncharacterized protein (DUF2141 family)